jgi:hypothetical protein
MLLARSREYELNAAADERAQAGDREDHVAAQCFFMIALTLRELADVLTERKAETA